MEVARAAACAAGREAAPAPCAARARPVRAGGRAAAPAWRRAGALPLPRGAGAAQRLRGRRRQRRARAHASEDTDADADADADARDQPPLACVERLGGNTVRVWAQIRVDTPTDAVWRVLTDYERLGEYVPSLAENEVLERYPDGGARLRQVGEQSLALGVKFRAECVLDVREFPQGCPERYCETGLDGDGDGSEGSSSGGDGPPCERTEQWPGGRGSDISFDLVKDREGDFKEFQGVWSMRECDDGVEGGAATTALRYSVRMQPRPWLPVLLVQGRIAQEVEANVRAVKAIAEKQRAEGAASAASVWVG